LYLGIFVGADSFTSGGAKGDEFVAFRVRQVGLGAGKECGVFGIAAGPTGFDKVYPKGYQSTCNLQLVVDRSRNGFTLCAV
jgi:hypothetical protein